MILCTACYGPRLSTQTALNGLGHERKAPERGSHQAAKDRQSSGMSVT